jgi:hypothetical protein
VSIKERRSQRIAAQSEDRVNVEAFSRNDLRTKSFLGAGFGFFVVDPRFE